MIKKGLQQFIDLISSTWGWVRRWSALIVLIVASFAFLTNFCGVYCSETGQCDWLDCITNSAYKSTQATLLGEPLNDRAYNGWIGFGRVAAICLTTIVAVEVIGRLFRDSFRILRLKLSPREKAFVCGLGRIGFQKTQELLAEGKQVTVVELQESSHYTKLAEKAGAIIFQGDVTDALGLNEHVRRCPSEIYLVTGHDHSNITALENVRFIRNQQFKDGKTLAPVTCYLHISDYILEQEVRRSQVERDAASADVVDSVQVELFNIFSETGRQLIFDHLAAGNIRPRQQNEVALYVIVGFGQMGKALLRQIAEHAHFENKKRARVLVLTPNAQQECDDYLARWGRLAPRVVFETIMEVNFDAECDAWGCRKARPLPPFQVASDKAVEYVANVQFCEYAGSAVSKDLTSHLVRLAEDQGVRPAVMFCFDEREQNFKLANQLNETLQSDHGINKDLGFLQGLIDEKRSLYRRQSEFHLPVFVFLPQSEALCNAFICSKEKYHMIPFGDVVSALKNAFDHSIEEIAIEIAKAYETNANGEPFKSREEYLPIWRQKSYWDRHSNLSAARHSLLKLQLLGYRPDKGNENGPSALSFDGIDLEQKVMLGIIEHNRWMSERLMMGWCFGPRSEQPPQRPSICDKSCLPPDELIKDFEQVCAVFNYWQKAGYHMDEI